VLYDDGWVQIHQGNALDALAQLPGKSETSGKMGA